MVEERRENNGRLFLYEERRYQLHAVYFLVGSGCFASFLLDHHFSNSWMVLVLHCSP